MTDHVDEIARHAAARLLGKVQPDEVEVALADVRSNTSALRRIEPTADASTRWASTRLFVIAAAAIIAIAGLAAIKHHGAPPPAAPGPSTVALISTSTGASTAPTVTTVTTVPPTSETADHASTTTIEGRTGALVAGTEVTIEQLAVASPNSWWAIATDSTNPVTPISAVVRSTDGGNTWRVVPELPAGPIYFATADDGWIGTRDGVVTTHDAGSTWSDVTGTAGFAAWTIRAAKGEVVFAGFGPNGPEVRRAGAAGSGPAETVWAFAGCCAGPSYGASLILETGAADAPDALLSWNSRGMFSGARRVAGVWTGWDPFPDAGCEGLGIEATADGRDIAAMCGTSTAPPGVDGRRYFVSRNAGRTFAEIRPPADAQVAWVAPGILLAVADVGGSTGSWRSDDAGATWTDVVVPGDAIPASGVDALRAAGPGAVAVSAARLDGTPNELWIYRVDTGWVRHRPRIAG